jgi:hypothetical protein
MWISECGFEGALKSAFRNPHSQIAIGFGTKILKNDSRFQQSGFVKSEIHLPQSEIVKNWFLGWPFSGLSAGGFSMFKKLLFETLVSKKELFKFKWKTFFKDWIILF